MKRMALVIGIAAAIGGVAATGLVGRAQAQEAKPGFKQCIAVSLYAISGRDLNAGQLPDKTVKIPAGWTVAGGTVVGAGSNATPGMVLCQ